MDLFSGSFGCLNPPGTDAASAPESGNETKSKIKIWVLKCSRTGRVHYLEAYKDFVDLLLGFLMLRTGALIKLNRQVSPVTKQVKSSTGIYGVYDGFKRLDDSVVIVDKEILLDPFEKLRVSEELQSLKSGDFECCNEDCFKYLAGSRRICRSCAIQTHFSCSTCGGYFRENAHTALCYTPWRPWRNHMTAAPILTRYTVIQSSSPTPNKPKKEGYVKMNIPFIITNDLIITPFSTSNVAEVLKNCGAGSCEDLECNELSIGRPEVLVMVGAALTSTTPLTDIFGKMCNKKTRVFSSASFSQLPPFLKTPPSHDHDDLSVMRQKSAVIQHAIKNEKDLPDQALRPLPIRQQIQEQTTEDYEPPEGVGRSQSMRKQLHQPIPKKKSLQQGCAAERAPEHQPNCLGVCPSCRKQHPEKTPEQSPFQEWPVAEEAPEAQPEQVPTHVSSQEGPVAQKEPQGQPSSLGGSSSRKQQQAEQLPTQFSFQQQPASHKATLEPQTTTSESSLVEVSDSENSPKQPLFVQRCLQNTSETQPMEQTVSRAQNPSVPSEDALCEQVLLTRAPYSQTFIRHSTQVSSQSLPRRPVPCESHSVFNPLFQETSPSDVPLSRLFQTPPPPAVVDVSFSQARPYPRTTSCIPHSTTHAPSIVRRSYQPAIHQHGRTNIRHIVRFGKNCAAHGTGSFPLVSTAFEQGSSEGLDCSKVQSSTSDGSDHSSFLN